MTAPVFAPATALLRRAGLIAAVLAIIAGILGMHVMVASHDVHSPALVASAVSDQHDSHPAGHGAEHASEPTETETTGPRTAQCTGSDNCACTQAMTVACTPLAKTGSLAAPLPGTGITARNSTPGAAGTVSARPPHLPGSPSPRDLSISRT